VSKREPYIDSAILAAIERAHAWHPAVRGRGHVHLMAFCGRSQRRRNRGPWQERCACGAIRTAREQIIRDRFSTTIYVIRTEWVQTGKRKP
jgi:hypothetical protein